MWSSAVEKNPTPSKTFFGSNKEITKDEYILHLENIKKIDDVITRDLYISKLSRISGISTALINVHLKIKSNDNLIVPVHIKDFLDYTSTPINWLIEELLPLGETVLLTAAPKVGKTLLAIDLIYSIVTGNDFIKYKANKGRVLFISADESSNSTRLKLMNRGFTENMDLFIQDKFSITDLSILEATINKIQPNLIVIDSLKSTARDSSISENSAEFSNAIYDLKELLEKHKVSGILIHHEAKGKDRENLERVRGSSAITGAVWGIWQMRTGNEGIRHLQITSRDLPPDSLTIKLDEEIGTWQEIVEVQDPNNKPVKENIIKLLEEYSPLGLEASEIKDKLKINDGTIYNTLNRLVIKKIIGKRPNSIDGKRPVYYIIKDENSNTENITPVEIKQDISTDNSELSNNFDQEDYTLESLDSYEIWEVDND